MTSERPPRGRPRPRKVDEVPELSHEEVERRVDVRGGGAPRAPIERPVRDRRPPPRQERTVARDSILLIGLVIVGLVAVRVLLPDGPLTASETNAPSGTQAVVVSVAPSTVGPVSTPGLLTLPPRPTPSPDLSTPTVEPTVPGPTPTLKPGQTPKPTAKPTAVPTPGPTDPNRATVKVVMRVINNSGGSTPASAWKMSVTGEAGGSASKNNFAGSETGTTVTIPAGQGYRVLDDASQVGYAPRLSSPDCSRPTGAGLAAGTTVTCTITRNDRPRVRVVTHVINNDAGTGSANDWAISVTSANATPKNFQGSESGTIVIIGFDISFSIATSGGPSGYVESEDGVCSGLGLGIDAPAALCTFTEDDETPPPTLPGSVIPPLFLPLLRPRRWRTTATG